MNLLLDTHALIWALADDAELSGPAREAIVDPGNLVYASAGSVWEIAIKQALGKLRVPSDVNEQIAAHRFEPLPIEGAHAWRAGALPAHHSDPFDRILVAQALEEGLTLVTRDSRIPAYGVPCLAA